MSFFYGFLKDETGAVTVDWVVLTAGVVILGLVAVTPMLEPLREMAIYIGDTITAYRAYLD